MKKMKLNPIHVEATTLPDAWFQVVYKCLETGRDFLIDRGSFEGEKRLEFDYITVHIKKPGAQPLLPQIPEQYHLPNPVEDDYLSDYLPYLMTGALKPGESYTYGQRICRYPLPAEYSDYTSAGNQDILIQDSELWTDKNIIAITPFILDYTDPPFSNFSWTLKEDNFVPWYQTVKDFQKLAGAPEQYNKLITLRSYLPQELTVNRTYQGSISIQNIGQKIIGRSDLSAKIKTNHKDLDFVIGTNDQDIHPSQVVLLPITINTSQIIYLLSSACYYLYWSRPVS